MSDSHMRWRSRPYSTPSRSPRFAIVSYDVIASGLDNACVRLFALVASYPHDLEDPVMGLDRIGRMMGWQGDTVKTHAEHLAEAGLLALLPRERKQFGLALIHHPGPKGGPINPLATIPPAPERYRKPSKFALRVPCDSPDRSPKGAEQDPTDEWEHEDTRPVKGASQSDSMKYGEGVCAVCDAAIQGHIFGDHEPVLRTYLSSWSVEIEPGLFADDLDAYDPRLDFAPDPMVPAQLRELWADSDLADSDLLS